jgi:DNA-binding response OmpR family regulator
MRSVLVEDDPHIQDLLAERLRRQGFDVFATASGRAGLERIVTAGIPDLVVLDLGLPDVNGRAIAHQLLSVPATADMPVIAVSSLDPAWDDPPVFACLVKPFPVQQFDEALAGVVAGHAGRRALAEPA